MTQFIKLVWQEMIRHLWVFLIFLGLATTSITTWILTTVHGEPLDILYFFIASLSSVLTVLFLLGFIIEATRQSRKKDQRPKLDNN